MTTLLIVGGVVFGLFALTVFLGAPYVPTRRADVATAFDALYPLSNKDTLVDIGSGDGVVLRAAARRGARAVGYEINPILVVISWLLSIGNARVSVRLANFWQAKVPHDTTVIYTFGEGRDIERMARWTQKQATRLGKPLFFISYAFELKTHTPIKKIDALLLYEIAPLHEKA